MDVTKKNLQTMLENMQNLWKMLWQEKPKILQKRKERWKMEEKEVFSRMCKHVWTLWLFIIIECIKICLRKEIFENIIYIAISTFTSVYSSTVCLSVTSSHFLQSYHKMSLIKVTWWVLRRKNMYLWSPFDPWG